MTIGTTGLRVHCTAAFDSAAFYVRDDHRTALSDPGKVVRWN